MGKWSKEHKEAEMRDRPPKKKSTQTFFGQGRWKRPPTLSVGGHVGPGLRQCHQLQLLRTGQLIIDVVEGRAETEVEVGGRGGTSTLKTTIGSKDSCFEAAC